MKLSKLLFIICTVAICSAGCTQKSKKMKEAKVRKDLEIRENRKDIEELEASSDSTFFEPDADIRSSMTAYELGNLLSGKASQRFILQDPKVLEAYPTGDTYDVYFHLGPDVMPRPYSYLFKVSKIKKEDLDLFIVTKNEEEGRIFLVLKKLQIVSPVQAEVEAKGASKQVVFAEFVEIKKLSKAKVIAEKMKIAKLKDIIHQSKEENAARAAEINEQ